MNEPLERSPARFWILDRGVGILATLRRADSGLATEQQAIDAAFERVLSGRAPERRGNGLKFVRSIVNGNAHRALLCQSGHGSIGFGGLLGDLAELQQHLARSGGRGVATVLAWRPES